MFRAWFIFILIDNMCSMSILWTEWRGRRLAGVMSPDGNVEAAKNSDSKWHQLLCSAGEHLWLSCRGNFGPRVWQGTVVPPSIPERGGAVPTGFYLSRDFLEKGELLEPNGWSILPLSPKTFLNKVPFLLNTSDTVFYLQGLYLDVQLQTQHLDSWLQNITCLFQKDMPVAVSGLCNVCKRAFGRPHAVTKVQEYACKADLSQFILSRNCQRHVHRCAPLGHANSSQADNNVSCYT